jgi:hypothetical protein
MLQLVGQHPQSQCLRCGKGFLTGRSVDQDSRQVNDLGDPAAVLFPVQFDSQMHVLRLAHSPHWSWVQRSYAKALYGSPSSGLPMARN